MAFGAEALVSITRVQELLLMEENEAEPRGLLLIPNELSVKKDMNKDAENDGEETKGLLSATDANVTRKINIKNSGLFKIKLYFFINSKLI